MYTYPIQLTAVENNQFMVEFPDVPQALTYGETKEQALDMAQDVLHETLDKYMDMKLDIPQPSEANDKDLTISVSPMIGIKLCIYQTMREKGINQEKLAQLLTCDPKQIRRLLDVFHNSTLDQLVTALEVLGYKLEMRTKPIQEIGALG